MVQLLKIEIWRLDTIHVQGEVQIRQKSNSHKLQHWLKVNSLDLSLARIEIRYIEYF